MLVSGWNPRRLAPVAAVAAAAVVLLGCGQGGGGSAAVAPQDIVKSSTLSAILDRRTLRVGMEVEFPPFEYRDASGKPVGFDVDLVEHLARELGVELEVVEMEFSGMIGSLVTGKIDIAVSGITATLERARSIAFSRPYHLTELCLLVGKGSRLKSHRDLDDPSVTLVVKKGTTGQTVAEAQFKKAKLKVFTQEAACALEVAQGKADAFVYDKTTLIRHHAQHADTTRLIPEAFSVEPYAIAFRQGEPDLGRFLDQFLATLELDGRMQAMRDKHLAEPPASAGAAEATGGGAAPEAGSQ